MIARRHSFRTGTLRYFAVEYVTREVLSVEPPLSDEFADGRIVVMFDGHGKETDLQDVLSWTRKRKDTVVVIPRNSREVSFLAQELACIQWVKENTQELAGDSTARREIDARHADVHRKLQTELTRSMVGQEDGTLPGLWFHNGHKLTIMNHRDLNEALSTVLDGLYKDAPVINNEIINRRELSSSAAAARRNLMQQMVMQGSTSELGITGNPPERSIYLSVLRELGLHIKGSQAWHFTTEQRSAKKQAGPLFAALRSFFESAEQQQRNVAELFSMLQSPPFGLRLGVVPIVVCAAFIGHEADVAIYEGGAFVSQLTVPIIERLIKNPDTFALRRWRVTGVRSVVFQQLAEMLGQQSLPDRIGRREILEVVKPLLRFVRKLDAFTLGTQALASRTLAVRDVLTKAIEPDQLLFVDLPQACGVHPFDSKRRADGPAVQEYMTALRGAISDLQSAYERLLAGLHASLADVFGCTGDLRKMREALSNRFRLIEEVALDPELRTLVSRTVDSTSDDRQWLESIAALLATKPPPNWRDEDRARFDVALGQRARRLKSLEALVADRNRTGAGPLNFESIRLGVAGTGLADRDTVVHIPAAEMQEADSLAQFILGHLHKHAPNGHRAIALAAIAKAAHGLLEIEHDRSMPALVGATS
ncbi:MAG: hypothetical protein L0219_13855 [Phycisphaerales bacterium]|nr:hypothetical protein [Phycisphaerales bacterium]